MHQTESHRYTLQFPVYLLLKIVSTRVEQFSRWYFRNHEVETFLIHFIGTCTLLAAYRWRWGVFYARKQIESFKLSLNQ